tara:strand:- start:6876 stop:7673 length:798 start_codon:yes stop_codon:yes gene_type:complete
MSGEACRRDISLKNRDNHLMIEINDAHKSFGATQVIPGLSLSIPQGQTHILLGSSGCGKTTLLRMIAGLTSPDQGAVTIAGQSVGELSKREISNKIGYVIQEGGLLPHLNGIDNVLLPVKIRGRSLTQAMERLESFAAAIDLTMAQLRRFPHEISGGQRQRVALLRGMILDQPIVLLDEPLSALDPVVRMNLQRHLKDIFKKLNKTVVLVTHDLHVASFLGDIITLLDQGRIVQQGSFEELLEQPKNDFVRDFVQAQTPMKRVMA